MMADAPPPKLGAVILARMDSTRLPGKALADICGKPLLWYVASRLPRHYLAGPPILATTVRAIDTPLADTAAEMGLSVFRGATDDVAGRTLAAAEAHGLDGVLRVNGDSPFLDADLIARAVDIFRQGQVACVTNLRPRSYPYGVSVELFRPDSLRSCLAKACSPHDREHVTPSLYAHLDPTQIHNLIHPEGAFLRDEWRVRLTIDEPADLKAFRLFVAGLTGPWEKTSYQMAAASGLFSAMPPSA